jgi:aspartate racemase
MADKTAGILGGMGPLATVDLMQRIIRLTPALDDRDHIRLIVDNNPKVPSRIKALIEGTGEDPEPCLVDMARRLETWGADFLAIACNTAHHWHGSIQAAVSVPVIHLVEVVARHLSGAFPGIGAVGILASKAVAMTGLYRRWLGPLGIREIWPDPDHQERLMAIIRAVKQGETGPAVHDSCRRVCRNLTLQGASALIVACTELSALAPDLPLPAVDAADLLAREIVRRAREGQGPSPRVHGSGITNPQS